MYRESKLQKSQFLSVGGSSQLEGQATPVMRGLEFRVTDEASLRSCLHCVDSTELRHVMARLPKHSLVHY